MRGIALAMAAIAIACVGVAQKGAPVAGGPKLTLGKPSQFGTIAIVPIYSERAISHEKYITLAQATKQGLVEIVEIPGRETVNNLEVRNKSKLPLLLFAGELLLGGKQDRIVGKDTIVPPGEKVSVPVFCVEHGRWSNSDGKFRGGDTFVPESIRRSTYEKNNQSEVWKEVARSNSQANANPATQTIQGALNDPKVRAASDDLYAKLIKASSGWKDAVGVVCWLNGEIHSADIFANPNLFVASKDKLLRSYAYDAQLVDKPKSIPVDLKACADFLNQIMIAKRSLNDRDGTGSRYRVSNGKITGHESGNGAFGGGMGGGRAGGAGFGHGTYKPGKGGGSDQPEPRAPDQRSRRGG